MKIALFSSFAKKLYSLIVVIITLWTGFEMSKPYLGFEDESKNGQKKVEPEKEVVVKYVEKESTTKKKTPTKKETKTQPNTKVVKTVRYFDASEKYSEQNSVGLFLISSSKEFNEDLQTKVSDLLVEKNIPHSTTIFKNSTSYFNKFRSANKAWLEEIKLKDHIGAYIVGQIQEEQSNSSENQKITIVDLSFSGRFVQLKPFKIHPLNFKGSGTSFNAKDAKTQAYDELAKVIEQKIEKSDS